MFDNYKKQYAELWKMFIRPYRQVYSSYDLGPQTRVISNKIVMRHDFELKNSRNLILKCSFFQITQSQLINEKIIPDSKVCVIYLHCNAASRIEAIPLLPYLIEKELNLLCFDFSGCGQSEGEYISLGIHETKDLETIVSYIRKEWGIKYIALWGRSMGAVTALRYAAIDKRICCVISDSPFSNLKELALEFARERTNVPGFLLKGAFSFVKRSIKKRADFNINDLDQTKIVNKCTMPVIFLTSKEDNFVKYHHIEKLYLLYAGTEKKIIYVKGDHNEERPFDIYREISNFCFENLNNKHISLNSSPNKEEKDIKNIIFEERKINVWKDDLNCLKDRENKKNEYLRRKSSEHFENNKNFKELKQEEKKIKITRDSSHITCIYLKDLKPEEQKIKMHKDR